MKFRRRNKAELEENAEKVLENSHLPVVISRNESRVNKDFWKKFKKFARRIPFAEDLVAAYYCAIDPTTPIQVRGVLLAALAYFILPTDLVPDFILGFGFTDDATVLATAVALVSSHIKPTHREDAQKVLAGERETDTDEAA